MEKFCSINWIKQNTVEQLLAVSKTKKVIFWGTSNEASRFFNSELSNVKINISYFCDNSKEKQGKQFLGYNIYSPEKLKQEEPDNVAVVICSQLSVLNEIINQLQDYKITHLFASALFGAENQKKYIYRFSGDYIFVDRRQNYDKLLIILTGYKEFLWSIVFKRIIAFLPEKIDVCLVLSGKDDDKMKEMAANQNWSYLSTKNNNVSLVQNIAISLHKSARLIFKLDEDIFIGKDYFLEMEKSFKHLQETSLYKIGFLSPLVPINICSFWPFLKKMNLESIFKNIFKETVMQQSSAFGLFHNKEMNKFLWDNSLPFDVIANKIKQQKTEYITCPYRFSIGAILFHRELWKQMIGFDIGIGNGLGADEAHICEFCMYSDKAIFLDTNIFAGHLSYGQQTEYMKEYYSEHYDLFDIKDTN